MKKRKYIYFLNSIHLLSHSLCGYDIRAQPHYILNPGTYKAAMKC